MTSFGKTSLPLLESKKVVAASSNMAQAHTKLQALTWPERSTLFTQTILDVSFFVAFSVIKVYQRHQRIVDGTASD